MIQSMTGYGSAQGRYGERILRVEMKSVNHRHCSVVVHLPRFLASMEELLKKKVQARFSRGRIDLFVGFTGPRNPVPRITPDFDAAGAVYEALLSLKNHLKLSGEIDLSLLCNVQNLFSTQEQEVSDSALERSLMKLLSQAMLDLEKMRKAEGKALAADLSARLKTLSGHLSTLKAQEHVLLQAHHARLQARVAELSGGLAVDPARLAQEVALLAERADITEERTRLQAHVTQFRKMLRRRSVGRSLEFLLQEMQREVNTLSAKSSDLSISMQAVEMKGELEKIREQVLNIE